jgi:hypothetical protein
MGGSIGEDGEARPCILELVLASREKNGLHLVACFSWKKEGDELRRQRETGIKTGPLAMHWGTRGRGCGLRVCGHGVGTDRDTAGACARASEVPEPWHGDSEANAACVTCKAARRPGKRRRLRGAKTRH